ncbi:MAG: RNA polymerase sigma factor [Bacteroidota bacterium]
MSESDFIQNLREGTREAYAQLLEQYQQKVFHTSMSFVPNKEDAEDVAQEVFVEVYRSIHKFKGGSKLSTWIYRITVNKSLEFLRRKNTKKRFAFVQSIFGNDVPLDKTAFFTEVNHPGVLLERKEDHAVLMSAINKLPDAQRVVFTLHKIDDKSYKEISEITEKSISSVESLMFRAKRNLQKILGEFYKNRFQ